jgi:hypothetical protein
MGDPLSTAKQTRKDGRFAPAVFHRKLDLDADICVKILEQWLMDGVIKQDQLLKGGKTYIKGLAKGTKALPFSALSPMQYKDDDSGVDYDQPPRHPAVPVGSGSDDDFG